MNAPPAFTTDQSRRDEDHLDLLAVFHFVGAGLAFMAVAGLIVHFALMHAVLEDPAFWAKSKHPPPPEFIKTILDVFYVFFGLWFSLSLVLNLLSGIFLRTRRYRTFSLIVGAVNCLHVPLGTVLGIFTLVVLLRSSVRELYEAQTRRR